MNKFKKLYSVGRGAFGSVYLCQRLEDLKQLIIKMIPLEEMTSEEREFSLNESKVLSMLDHPNIIAYYDHFLEDKTIVIVMEYAPGGNLLKYLQERKGVLLHEEEILHLFAQMVMALQHVHSRQILHRDLKTQNIFMNKDVIKLGDFGISKILVTRSKACSVVGTPCYISPELCEGKPYNQKSDIWSLGCVLYELLTLKKPFEGDNLPALVVKIMRGNFETVPNHYSNDLRQLLVCMLATDPARRPLIPQIMARPCLVRIMYPLYLYIGLVPQTVKTDSTSPSQTKSSCKKNLTGSIDECAPNNKHPFRIVRYSKVSGRGANIFSSTSNSGITSVAVGKCRILLAFESGLAFELRKGTGLRSCLWETPQIHIVQVVCGDGFNVFLTNRGLVMTVGNAENYCLGHGTAHVLRKPKVVESLLGMDVVHIACGREHVVALTKEGFVFSWGNGQNGKLGLGSNATYLVPQKVPLAQEVLPCQAVCTVDATYILTKSCQLYASGSNRYNKLGMDNEDGFSVDKLQRFTEVTMLNELKIKAVACGETHTAVLSDDGHCFTFGSNKHGQLGRSDSIGCVHNLPGRIEIPENEVDTLMQVSCGTSFTVALAPSGKLLLWGTLGTSPVLNAHNLNTPKSAVLSSVIGDTNSVIAIFKG